MIYPSYISTSALSFDTRSAITKTQQQLVEAQTELSTGKHADLGLSLGAATGLSVAMRQEQTQLQAVRDSNALVASRLTATQNSLQNISDLAQNYLAALVHARGNPGSPSTVVAEAKTGMQALADRLNTNFDGQFLFAGINADVRPTEDYFANPAPVNRQSIASAFLAQFGFNQSSAAAGSITQSAMQNFLDGSFANQFSDVNWASNWSAASDRNVRSRVSRTELQETSTNANEQAFRDLTAAFTMVSDLGFENLNDNARAAVLDKAVKFTGNAIAGVATIQSGLGVTQERLSTSSTVLDVQLKHLGTAIDSLESVDPNEAATRLSTLMNQIEVAYSITKRVHDLTIMNYL